MPAGVEVERVWALWWAPRAGGRSACPEARYLWGKGWGWAPWWAHPPSAEVPAKLGSGACRNQRHSARLIEAAVPAARAHHDARAHPTAGRSERRRGRLLRMQELTTTPADRSARRRGRLRLALGPLLELAYELRHLPDHRHLWGEAKGRGGAVVST